MRIEVEFASLLDVVKIIQRIEILYLASELGLELAGIEMRNRSGSTYTIDSSLVFLRKQLTDIDRRIEELQLIRSRLLHRCVQMENAKTSTEKETSVVIENSASRYILFHEVKKPYSFREISIASKKCFAQSFQEHLPVFFPALYNHGYTVLSIVLGPQAPTFSKYNDFP